MLKQVTPSVSDLFKTNPVGRSASRRPVKLPKEAAGGCAPRAGRGGDTRTAPLPLPAWLPPRAHGLAPLPLSATPPRPAPRYRPPCAPERPPCRRPTARRPPGRTQAGPGRPPPSPPPPPGRWSRAEPSGAVTALSCSPFGRYGARPARRRGAAAPGAARAPFSEA